MTPSYRRKLKTREDMLAFVENLVMEVKEGDRFNAWDGLVVGFIYANSKAIATLMLTKSQLPPASDNIIQQVEVCINWLLHNYERIKDLLPHTKKSS